MSNPASGTTSAVPMDLKPRLAASYDALAPVYNAWTVQHSALRVRMLERLLDLLPAVPTIVAATTSADGAAAATATTSSPPAAPLSVLELGCGAGDPVTKMLVNKGFVVAANDISPGQVELARAAVGGADAEKDGRVAFLVGDMMGLEFPDGRRFDAVVAMYSLIHLPREEQTAIVAKMARQWLKPGGLVLANFSMEDREAEVIENWLGDERGWMFWSGWGVEKTTDVVREAGLEVLVKEVVPEDGVKDVEFLWIIAKKGEKDE